MSTKRRDMSNRLKHFLIFILLTIVTVGLYPIYFWVSRMEEQSALLDEMLAELQSKRVEPRL